MPKQSSWHKKIPEDLPKELHDWLVDPGSMTEKLKKASGGSLYLNLLYCDKRLLLDNEAIALQVPLNSIEAARLTVLGGEKGKPWIYGSSIFPDKTVFRYERLWKGVEPLGNHLFKSSTIISDLEFAQISLGSIEYEEVKKLFQQSVVSEDLPECMELWARRRIFWLEGEFPVMVTEVFLKDHPIYAFENNAEQKASLTAPSSLSKGIS